MIRKIGMLREDLSNTNVHELTTIFFMNLNATRFLFTVLPFRQTSSFSTLLARRARLLFVIHNA